MNEIEYFHPIDDYTTQVDVNVVSVYDGDTCTIVFRLFNDPEQRLVKFKARLIGVDTAEMKGTDGHVKELAIKARDFIRENTIGKSRVKCIFSKEMDKYGRLLVRLFTSDGVCLNDELIKMGLAKDYSGGTKEKW
jgi:endonuclease YncB( thermonuclease family)